MPHSAGVEEIFHCGVYCRVLRKSRGVLGDLRDMDPQESLIFTGVTGW
jgi:hypothetical protein